METWTRMMRWPGSILIKPAQVSHCEAHATPRGAATTTVNMLTRDATDMCYRRRLAGDGSFKNNLSA